VCIFSFLSIYLTIDFGIITHSAFVLFLFNSFEKFTKRANDEISFILHLFHIILIKNLFFHHNRISFLLLDTEVNAFNFRLSFEIHQSHQSHLNIKLSFQYSKLGIFSNAFSKLKIILFVASIFCFVIESISFLFHLIKEFNFQYRKWSV